MASEESVVDFSALKAGQNASVTFSAHRQRNAHKLEELHHAARKLFKTHLT